MMKMKRIKVKIVGDGTKTNPFRVNLPTYMIDCQRDELGNPVCDPEGTPLDSVDYAKKECYVLVPDDEVDEKGINEAKIREKYKESWSKFEAKDVEA